MSIAAANVAPDFTFRRRITADDLKRLVDPAVIFEYSGIDADNVPFFVYTVAGWLDGENIATINGGATVGGDVIVISADTREQADMMAGMGLDDSINALFGEEEATLDALAARARLESVNPLERLDLSMNAKEYPKFVEDSNKMRTLVGDDIVLATSH